MSENGLDFNRFCNLIKEWDGIDELPDGIQNEEERWDYVFVYLGWNRKDKLCFIANMLINMAYSKKPAEKTEIYDEICSTMKIVANEKDSPYGEFLKRVLREQIKFVMESLVELGFPSFILTHFTTYVRKEFDMQNSLFNVYLYNAFVNELKELFGENTDVSEEKLISFGYIADSFQEKYGICLREVAAKEGPAGNGISMCFDFCKNPDDFAAKYVPYMTDLPMSYALIRKLKGNEAKPWIESVFLKAFEYAEKNGGDFSLLKGSFLFETMKELDGKDGVSEDIKEKMAKI